MISRVLHFAKAVKTHPFYSRRNHDRTLSGFISDEYRPMFYPVNFNVFFLLFFASVRGAPLTDICAVRLRFARVPLDADAVYYFFVYYFSIIIFLFYYYQPRGVFILTIK